MEDIMTIRKELRLLRQLIGQPLQHEHQYSDIMERLLDHEHPLQLIDMQPQYPHYEEEFDDEDDDDDVSGGEEDNLSRKWDFHRPCSLCGREINWYHRYYYKCKGSCDYWLHRFCGEIPTTLTHTSHRALNHTLTLTMSEWFRCEVCRLFETSNVVCYLCRDCDCEIGIHVNCILKQEENHPIYHPSHPHPLVLLTSEPILCKCDACGKKHMGMFYQCTTPLHLSIHRDCAFLPKMLSTQHTHPLALSYSFPYVDQKDRFNPRCRVCGDRFGDENIWIYKCEICRYYVHLDCATSRGEPFMSIFRNPGFGKLVKNFEDADHPDLLNLPFHDQTYDILQHLFFKENADTTSIATNERNLNHIGHQHPLIMVGDITTPTSPSKNLLCCHNPMKKIELLCNGCIRPIMNTPFYKCATCQFVIHVWCTSLPTELLNYERHPEHKLIFLPKVLSSHFSSFNVFNCDACGFHCNGFAYGCIECKYYIDVTCGLLPQKITHEAHPGHLLSRAHPGHLFLRETAEYGSLCFACRGYVSCDADFYNCQTCGICLHPECALLLPSMITHRLDKHPLKLRYQPVENHKSQYFCEICEEELNPNQWFYHCNVCVQSMHCRCFPLITECERAIPLEEQKTKVFQFFKIKFGGSYNLECHQHSLLFSQGISIDGCCSSCSRNLEYQMILKCLKCKFAIHLGCIEDFNIDRSDSSISE